MTSALARGAAAMMTTMAVVTATPAQADSPEPLYNLVDAAAQRLQTADAVAANKWLTGGPITDPARVKVVLDAVSKDAESRGVATDYVTSAFTNQINATEAIEYALCGLEVRLVGRTEFGAGPVGVALDHRRAQPPDRRADGRAVAVAELPGLCARTGRSQKRRRR